MKESASEAKNAASPFSFAELTWLQKFVLTLSYPIRHRDSLAKAASLVALVPTLVITGVLLGAIAPSILWLDARIGRVLYDWGLITGDELAPLRYGWIALTLCVYFAFYFFTLLKMRVVERRGVEVADTRVRKLSWAAWGLFLGACAISMIMIYKAYSSGMVERPPDYNAVLFDPAATSPPAERVHLVPHNNAVVRYTPPVTETHAIDVGQYLYSTGLLKTHPAMSVTLTYVEDHFQLYIPVHYEHREHYLLTGLAEAYAIDLSRHVQDAVAVVFVTLSEGELLRFPHPARLDTSALAIPPATR